VWGCTWKSPRKMYHYRYQELLAKAWRFLFRIIALVPIAKSNSEEIIIPHSEKVGICVDSPSAVTLK
jgi:hypothetical protein